MFYLCLRFALCKFNLGYLIINIYVFQSDLLYFIYCKLIILIFLIFNIHIFSVSDIIECFTYFLCINHM